MVKKQKLKEIVTDDKGQVLDEMSIGDNVKIVFQKRTYGKKEFIDIRKWIKTVKYTGFTAKGIAIEKEFVKPLAKKLLGLKIK